MITYAPLLPPPGAYKLPKMNLLRISSTEDPAVLQMIFETERRNEGQTEQLSVAVPISALDAAGLLRSLRILQENGSIPAVAEPTGVRN